jgi:hypothetical protein
MDVYPSYLSSYPSRRLGTRKEGRTCVWEDDGKMMRRISGNNFVRFAVFTLTRVSHSDRQTNRFTVRILNDST